MQPLQPEMIAIDLDGTLVDSVPDLHAAIVQMQRALVDFNPDWKNYSDAGSEAQSISTAADVRNWVGDGIERLVHRSLTNSLQGDAPAELFAAGLFEFRKAYQLTNGQHSSVYPNVDMTLMRLQEKKIPLCCVTNKSRAFSLSLLETHNLADNFSLVIAGDDIEHKKPHPESLLAAASHFGVKPSACLMVGDSIADLQAAMAAGFLFIGVSYGYNHGVSMHDVEQNPHSVIDNFVDLLNFI